MKRTRHSAEQIVMKLREADAMQAAGRTIAQLVQQIGVSEQTYNHRRPHTSLGYVPPAVFAATLAVPPVGAALLPPARRAWTSCAPTLKPRLS
jgi:hypothetical protein